MQFNRKRIKKLIRNRVHKKKNKRAHREKAKKVHWKNRKVQNRGIHHKKNTHLKNLNRKMILRINYPRNKFNHRDSHWSQNIFKKKKIMRQI